MDDGNALLQGVLENPGEDSRRLVYADWLDEHGDAARAEFIRVQVAISRIDPDSWVDTEAELKEQVRLYDRERELLNAANPDPVALATNELVWSLPAGASMRPVFRRGFVAKVTCDGEKWLENADRLLKAHPVEMVEFVGRRPRYYTFDKGLQIFHFPGRRQHQFTDLIDNRTTSSKLTERLLRAEWPAIQFALSV